MREEVNTRSQRHEGHKGRSGKKGISGRGEAKARMWVKTDRIASPAGLFHGKTIQFNSKWEEERSAVSQEAENKGL